MTEHPSAEGPISAESPIDERSIDDQFRHITESVIERLARNLRVRRNLPGEGRLRVDRQLPFLCVYRQPTDRPDVGTRELVTSEAAYLFASGNGEYQQGLSDLCGAMINTLQEHFGIFLLLEVWTPTDVPPISVDGSRRPPGFRIITPDAVALPSTLDAFCKTLESVAVGGTPADVAVEQRANVSPPGMPPLLQDCHESDGACFTIGLEVDPIYRDAGSGDAFPLVLQRLRFAVAMSLRKAILAFTGVEADAAVGHHVSLGPSTLVKAVAEIDEQLCTVSQSFDFLWQVTPTNSEGAWDAFLASNCESAPEFEYRPLPFHPGRLKRELFDIEIERVEDVTISHLFYEKQEELDRQITAIQDIGTSTFLFSSLQLYGDAEESLVSLAAEILDVLPPSDSGPRNESEYADVANVVRLAEQEIAFYHEKLPEFECRVVVCDDIASGIMVSRDRLLISDSLRLRRERVMPLLHHEIGTHLLTYVNGRSQPMRLLFAGLSGYEGLQEGLAVLAEYLAGGLTPARLRSLAGRTMAVRALCDGASFVETYRKLHEGYGFSSKSAFTTTLRVFRAGGLTKDAIYLRGLRDLLHYLDGGHEIEPLYVGKIALEHVPFIQELRRRGILHPPAALPRCWEEDSRLHQRLTKHRNLSVLSLLEINE